MQGAVGVADLLDHVLGRLRGQGEGGLVFTDEIPPPYRV
jgi:hypothetical protein